MSTDTDFDLIELKNLLHTLIANSQLALTAIESNELHELKYFQPETARIQRLIGKIQAQTNLNDR